MVRSKKAKAKAATAKSRQKAKDASMTPQSEASVSSSVMTGTTVEDVIDETELLNNEEDVKEVGAYQETGAEVSAGEENANEEPLGQGNGVIAAETMNSNDHEKEEATNEVNANEEPLGQDCGVVAAETMNSNEHEKEEAINEVNDNKHCFMEQSANITVEVMNCDVDVNKVGTEVQPLDMLNEVDQWFVTPTELNELKVSPEENATSGYLGEGDVTVTVGDYVEETNGENTCHKENCGEDTNVDGDRITDDTESEEEEEGDEKKEEEDEEEDEEEEEEEEEYGEENDQMDLVGEENDQTDEMDDTYLEDEIHRSVFNQNGDEDNVIGEGNCQGNVEELHVEEEENMVEAGENNLRIKVEETHAVVEIDGKTTDSYGNKKDVAGEVNCEGVIEQKEEGVERLTKQNIKRSRKRIRTSAGKLALKSRDGPSEKKLKHGVNEDPKEHKNGVPNIDNAKNNVAYKNKGKKKVGMHVGDSGGEKVQVNIEKKVGESSKKKTKRLKQKSKSGPLVEESLVKVASEIEGISGLSNKKNGLLKTDTKGMIFMCSSKTKPDCYRYKVLGLPAGKREMVENIFKGMILFLYDVQKKLLYGIYEAAADGGYDIEPEAFNSKFPAQVRFDIIEDCKPLEAEKFSKVIRANYFTRNKFDCQLNSGQVKNLCKLFRASIKDVKSERRKSRSDRGFRSAREKANLKSAPALFVAESPKPRRPLARKERQRRERPPARPPVRNEVGSLPRRPVRLSQTTASSFAYERTLDREVYRGEPSVTHTEIYRQQPFLEPRDTYRRELSLERRDTYSPDKYLEHRGTYRQERLLVPRDLYRVEQPQLRARDSFRQYPVMERDYDLEPLAEHRAYNLDPLADHMDYDLEPLAERRDYGLQPLPERHDPYRWHGSLLDHQEIYRNEPVLERQNRQLNLEPRDPYMREREVLVPRRDHSAYSGGVYSTAQPLRARMVPESRSVGLTTVYPSSAEAEPRYYSRRPVYRL